MFHENAVTFFQLAKVKGITLAEIIAVITFAADVGIPQSV
jgi:hypothetical protein